jgi:hypothetical protein
MRNRETLKPIDSKALLDRLPKDFNAIGCDPGSKDPAKLCGAAAIWVNVTPVDCRTPK